MCGPPPCRSLDAHLLHTHSRLAIGPRSSIRTNSTCIPRVLPHNNNHAMVQHAQSEMPIPKPWQNKESFSTKHAMEHSRPASTWKEDHSSYTDNQEQHKMSATCGAGHQQQACGHRARTHKHFNTKQCRMKVGTSTM